jgi:arginine/lysine/ornithine decarboxylase
LFDVLINHIRRSPANFHVPGHKQGQAFDEAGKEWFASVLQLDLTEIGELDDLHHPQGAIWEAQRLAAAAFRAEHTLFLVGGTTAGNLATILHLCRPGEEIIVQRNCHQSVFHGCMMAGAKPVFLPIEFDHNGMEEPLDPDSVRQMIQKYPRAKGVVITSPSYFGIVQNVREIAQVCHAHQMPLIVDEAHGAHLGFHPRLPQSAIDQGADVSIQSTHKLLTSMTMSSMLHTQGERVKIGEIMRWLRMIESSSPSYPLMASLDLARRWIATRGFEELERLLTSLDHFRGNVKNYSFIKEVSVLNPRDPLKLTLVADHGVSGYAMADWLNKQGIFIELADHQKVLFVFSVGTRESDLVRLDRVLKRLDEEIPRFPIQPRIDFPRFSIHTQAKVEFDELRRRQRRWIPLSSAVGEIATEMITPYPPGIPLVLPGEELREEVISFLSEVIRLGGNVRGIRYSGTPSVEVLV